MTAWTNKYVEALCLDMSILCLLIDRNRKQHYRASYFRRLDMLIRCMKRYNVLVDPGGSNTSSIIDIFESIKSENERIASILERCKSLQKRRGVQQEKVQDECWSLLSTDGQKESDLQPPFLQNMILLHESITQHLPEVLSRIMFAAASLYTELSRGYFAPLCTVALGCISRIRVLLLQFGRDAVLQYHKIMGQLEAEFLAVVLKGGQLEQQTGLSVESVKAFTTQYKLDLDFMNNFIDTNHYEHAAKMKEWKMEKIMQRGESNVSSRSELTKDVQSNASQSASETQRPDRTDDHELQDIIGELIETNNDEKSSGVESIEQLGFMAEKDDGDRNLELVKLVKEQRKKDKPTKRKATKALDMEGRLSKLPKVSERERAEDKGISSEWTEEVKSSKEKKGKTKKKKKKRSKDVIDAIFDQL